MKGTDSSYFDSTGYKMQLPVAAPRQRLIVGNEDQRGALRAVQFQHQFDDLAASGGVEVAGRFICKKNLGLDDEGARNRDALLLAAGEVFRKMRHTMFETDPPQGLRSALFRIGCALQFQWQHYVFQCAQCGQQLEGLEHEAGKASAQTRAAVFVVGEDVRAVQEHRTAGGGIETRQQAQQRGLAGTGCAEDRQAVARLDRETCLVQDGQRLVATLYLLRQSICLHNRHMKSLILKITLLVLIQFLTVSAHAANNIMVYGDSLSAGYGLAIDKGWVYLLQQELERTQSGFRVVNASISGETTAGGKQRITKALKQFKPKIVIVELGANDGLRGSPIKNMEANLDYIIRKSFGSGAKVLLLGMKLPPNYGETYTTQFADVYQSLAKKHGILLLPFLLEGVKPDQYQADNLHPVADAQQHIMLNVLRELKYLLH